MQIRELETIRTPPKPLARRILVEARPHAGPLALVFLVALVSTPLALLLPLPVQVAIDHVVGKRPLSGWLTAVLPSFATATPTALLTTCAVALVLVTIVLQAQELLLWGLRTWVSERLVIAGRSRLFHHLERLSLAWHDDRGVADSVYRVQADAGAAAQVVVGGWLPFSTALLRVGAVAWAVASLDGALALTALAAGPALFLLARGFRSRLRRGWKEARDRESASLAVVQESLSAMRVVKAFGREEAERDRFLDRARESLAAQLRAVLAHGAFDLLSGLVVGACAAAVLYVGVSHVLEGRLSLGGLVLATTWLAQLFGPLREVGTKSADLQRAYAAAERVYAVLDEAHEADDRPGLPARGRAVGRVTMKDVEVRYASRGPAAPPALEGVSFRVEPGARVGVAGRSGAGKTTLLNLLPRFYEPSAGTVALDGVDVQDWRLEDLRRQFAVVPQEPVLFSTSIRENVAYGRPGATEEEIVAAVKAANALAFVSALPEGFDTQVGDRGVKLSGGERQRLSLARAFLKDAPVLLLDEPTSSVDGRTEAGILEALERLMQGRTTFLLAHRLSTLEGCDVRLEVEGGRVRVSDAAPAGESV